eukprot:TRINITY_DN1917_c0_g1_i3.p1 TRINITY_DN1917_c0_g1~~TRINITY_DN1917_c0_g1_i3.p1  ORF type:complete len:528 (-),score=69.80 TRINITY_DN1917_c0_g1_i3:113-1696(-)
MEPLLPLPSPLPLSGEIPSLKLRSWPCGIPGAMVALPSPTVSLSLASLTPSLSPLEETMLAHHWCKRSKTTLPLFARSFPGPRSWRPPTTALSKLWKPWRTACPWFKTKSATPGSTEVRVQGCLDDTTVPSDPLKVAQFRGVLRARQACHQHKKCQQEDPLLFSFDRMLIKVIEHTWGMDVKTFLHDWANWSNSLFDKVRSASNYRDMVASWVEQRQFLYAARDTLADHPLGALIDQEWKALRPRRPETEGYAPVPPHSLTICGDVTLGLDPQSGGITTLKTGQLEWASPSHPLAQFRYTTFSEQDYRTFLSEYMYCSDCPWAPLDFGKKEVGAAHPHHQQVLSQIKSTWFKREASGTCSWLQEGVMSPSLVTNYGAPEVVWTQIQVEEGDISLSFQWFNKTSTRLPEALWLSFDPPPGGEWHIDKMGEWISPQDVVKNGSRHLHGVGQGVKYHKDGHTLLFQSVDAAVVSVGHLQPFPTPFTLANTTSGMHFNLYNNIWGTNYIMWYPYLDEDVSSLFRFKLLFQK